MSQIQRTVEFTDSNSYGSDDGFKLYACLVNGKVEEFTIKLLRQNLSTDGMRLLAIHLNQIADNIDAEKRKGK